MKMKSALNWICLVSAVSALLALSAFAQSDSPVTRVITFDDLSPGTEWSLITNGYGDLRWNRFGAINGSLRPLREGYRTGTVSPSNVAFNIEGDPAAISSPVAFDLKSAYLTAAFTDGLQVAVQGWRGRTLVYSNIHTLNIAGPKLINFNYTGVNLVRFVPTIHSGWFAMDNLTAVVRPDFPVVSIEATVPQTIEPFPDTNAQPGEFIITRTGSTSNSLTLYLGITGTATPKEDYESLPQTVVIPAGERTVKLLVQPLSDSMAENTESVIVTLREPPTASMPNYAIDPLQNQAQVFIRDSERPEGRPLVSLELVRRDAIEVPLYQNAAFWGEFRVIRTGNASNELAVFISTQGTATLGEDYRYDHVEGDTIVRFPAGQSSVNVRAYVIDDSIYEGDESIIVHLTPPPYAGPLPDPYEIDPAHATVEMVIEDNERPDNVISIEATRPIAEESSYPLRRLPLRGEFTISRTGPTNDSLFIYVLYSGTATPGVDYEPLGFGASIPAGATSTKLQIVPIDDGVPEPIETVVATLSHCPPLTDPPMGIPCFLGGEIDPQHSQATVFIRDNALETNSSPRIAITHPATGSEFPPDTAIEIVAEAVDADGYVPRVDFFADGRKIGEVNLAFIRPPDPGETQSFVFAWRGAAPGRHVLTAIAVDNAGNRGVSAPVDIKVGASEPLSILSVTAPDAFAVEPSSNSVINTATFLVRRYGPTNAPLAVAYSLAGTAENGIDYERLSGLATIPAGARSVAVIVRPLPDSLQEGPETVHLTLNAPTSTATEYLIGRAASATVAIADYPPSRLTAAQCVCLSSNLMHICFPVETDRNFRIEATSDWRTWETLFDCSSADGAWHFIDADVANHAQRFYRLTPEPVSEVTE